MTTEDAAPIINREPELDEKDAAEFLGVTTAALNKWRQRKRGPAYLKMYGAIRYPLSDLKEFKEKSRVVPPDPRFSRIRQSPVPRRGSR